jgi:hypothetical protein
MPRPNKLVALAALAASTACVLPGYTASPYGRTASVRFGSSRTDVGTGELLAVDSANVWIMRNDTLLQFDVPTLLHVDVSRHGFDFKRTFTWMAITGLLTGTALTIACNQVEGAECNGVLPEYAFSYGLLGAAFAADNQRSAVARFQPFDWQRMRAFARFPQGLPQAMRDKYPTLVVHR